MPDGEFEMRAGRSRKRAGGRPDGIFLSYRRSDAQEIVGRLADDLRGYFGDGFIYRDVDSTRPAQDYVVQIHQALSRSKVLVAIVGPTWLTSKSEDGALRLQNHGDLVRLELECAIADGIAIVPVLVGGASPPSAGELPPSLTKMSRLEACPMRDADWHYDLGRLFETLENHGVIPRPESDERLPVDVKKVLSSRQRFERTLVGSRRATYNALLGAVELLGYSSVERSSEGAQVRFRTKGRRAVAKVIDSDPGKAKVVVEFDSVRAAVLSGAGFAWPIWVSVRAWERRFAVGFLANVQGVLEGRGIQEDSSLPPGVHKWRSRSREV